jgi:hypothetical protein
MTTRNLDPFGGLLYSTQAQWFYPCANTSERMASIWIKQLVEAISNPVFFTGTPNILWTMTCLNSATPSCLRIVRMVLRSI